MAFFGKKGPKKTLKSKKDPFCLKNRVFEEKRVFFALFRHIFLPFRTFSKYETLEGGRCE